MSLKRKAVSYEFAEVTYDINGDFVDKDALFEERNEVITKDSAPPTTELPLWSQNMEKWYDNQYNKWEWSKAMWSPNMEKWYDNQNNKWVWSEDKKKQEKRVTFDKTVQVRIYLV